jgi:hypothetical protein
VLELYQAEWCPYSSAVRQRLTELGIDFVARQVAPRQDDRESRHEIPLLVTENGERFEGTDAVSGISRGWKAASGSAGIARSTARTAKIGRTRRLQSCSTRERRSSPFRGNVLLRHAAQTRDEREPKEPKLDVGARELVSDCLEISRPSSKCFLDALDVLVL